MNKLIVAEENKDENKDIWNKLGYAEKNNKDSISHYESFHIYEGVIEDILNDYETILKKDNIEI